jgi:hypothetical protein
MEQNGEVLHAQEGKEKSGKPNSLVVPVLPTIKSITLGNGSIRTRASSIPASQVMRKINSKLLVVSSFHCAPSSPERVKRLF